MKYVYFIGILWFSTINIYAGWFHSSLVQPSLHSKGFLHGFYKNKHDVSHADVRITQLYKDIYLGQGSLIIRLPFVKSNGCKWKQASLTSDRGNQQIIESDFIECVPKSALCMQPKVVTCIATKSRPYWCAHSYETGECVEELLIYMSCESFPQNSINAKALEQYEEQIFEFTFKDTGRYIFYLMNEQPFDPIWQREQACMEQLPDWLIPRPQAIGPRAHLYKFIIDVYSGGSMALGLGDWFMETLPNSNWAYFEAVTS